MRKVPDTWLFEPWNMPNDLKAKLGIALDEIPTPLVDLENATREGKAKLYAVRTRPDVRAGKTAIVEKHASRSAPRALSRARSAPRSKEKAPANQLSLEL
jgi:deoxyribodipyrimidine photo-lyase